MSGKDKEIKNEKEIEVEKVNEVVEEKVEEVVEEKIETPESEIEPTIEKSETTEVEEDEKAQEDIIDEPELNDELEEKDKSFIEKIKDFELDTKIGLVLAIIILLAVFINIEWINYTWWLMVILSGFSLRYLYKQKIELEEEKPFEARISNISFIALVVILVIRDLMITSRLSDLTEIFTR